ncbi:hypothetical protein [uncultured Paludibaculum sp.]|uniref:hypothetical protein n=1 Tax=uncultured Paludibaculum sp. TaxID=1765020 RepID=UPI002AAB017C|nr:hypothetical protein [uncultured Paludibaculum sp.]
MNLLRNAVMLLVCALSLSAQVTTDQKAFDAAYWAHQPPAVRAIQTATNQGQLATELTEKGFQVDVPIMVWGWSPYFTMLYRTQYGYTWVPRLGQDPVTIAPGLSVPDADFKPYDPDNPPAGSILVSLDLKDYPAYDPPAPSVPAPSGKLVGMLNYANVYFALAASQGLKDGDVVTQDGVKYKHRLAVYPFGASRWFEKVE